MKLIDDLKWRYACKAMNGKRVSDEKIQQILEAISLAPTSLGLQLFKVFVIENQDIKQKIREVANDQQTITGCSHLLVFVARTEVEAKDYDIYFKKMQLLRDYDDEKTARFRDRIKSFVDLKVADNVSQWLIYQTYIALGVATAAAAEARVNSVPIEGFDRKGVDQILSLKEKGYKSTLLFPIGYSDEKNDWMFMQEKVRKDMDVLVEYIR